MLQINVEVNSSEFVPASGANHLKIERYRLTDSTFYFFLSGVSFLEINLIVSKNKKKCSVKVTPKTQIQNLLSFLIKRLLPTITILTY